MSAQHILSPELCRELLQRLETRFHECPQRHAGLRWTEVLERLESRPAKLWSLNRMEETGGEPDVVDIGLPRGEICFVDCSAESPAKRRSLCYDRAALDSRRQAKPLSTALDMASEMGIELLSEEQYRRLQELRCCDLKTSSWVSTPEAIRVRGGALFCERRYDCVFVFHNGAESWFASRGFRGLLRI
ncbi:MAG: DUF4256 domain-containing protein [Planctomycetota bacterium]